MKQGKYASIQEKSGKCLTEDLKILKRWAVYRSDLYNYRTSGEPTALNCKQIPGEKPLFVLRENVEATAVKAMKMEKSLGTDSIAAELVKAGVVPIIERLT